MSIIDTFHIKTEASAVDEATTRFRQARREIQTVIDAFNLAHPGYTANAEIFDHGRQLGVAVINDQTGNAKAFRRPYITAAAAWTMLSNLLHWHQASPDATNEVKP